VLHTHQHNDAYLAVVLEGGYEEAGDGGCVRVQAGDVVLHSAFEMHNNRYNSSGSQLIVLGLPPAFQKPHTVMQVPDPDAIARIAERDPEHALQRVLTEMTPVDRESRDWPQSLALALRTAPCLRLEDWARGAGLAEATVSRGFAKVFGLTPTAYRARQKARIAWRMILGGAHSLPDVAFHAGFCDQAHMGHAIMAMTGRTPGAWRRPHAEVKWIQDPSEMICEAE
jgi:AraC-like DNA-binding protein